MHAAAVVCKGSIYLMGGLADQQFGINNLISKCEVFNSKTEKWTIMPRLMPKPVHMMNVHTNGPKVFVFGGAEMYKGKPESKDFVQVFDTRTGYWSRRERMPDALHCFASVQVDDVVYFLGGHCNVYKGKDLVHANQDDQECCICLEDNDGPLITPPGRECSGCNTEADVEKKCSCGLVRYCNAECQKLHWPDHKQQCKATRKAMKDGKQPVAKLGCGHVVHLVCYHKLCDQSIRSTTAVPCPLCRQNVKASSFRSKRSSEPKEKYDCNMLASTKSYNMSTNTWTRLKDAPFGHDQIMVLEEPGRDRIVSLCCDGGMMDSLLGLSKALVYNITTDSWTQGDSSIPCRPEKHQGAEMPVTIMLP
jgi:hypothetical protein